MSDRTSLDRIRWEAESMFESHGVSVSLRVNKADMLSAFPVCVPPARRTSPAAKPAIRYSILRRGGDGENQRIFSLYSGKKRLLDAPATLPILRRLESELHRSVATLTDEKIFVHAGVVAWRGRAILIPGRSFSGKSTLVHALIQAGATYYSDEYAVIGDDGKVHAFPRALRLRGDNGAEIRYENLSSSPLRPLTAGVIVVSKYRPGGRWNPRTLTPGEALLVLIGNTVAIRRRPEASLRALQQVTARAKAFRTVRGEAAEIAGKLLDRKTISQGEVEE